MKIRTNSFDCDGADETNRLKPTIGENLLTPCNKNIFFTNGITESVGFLNHFDDYFIILLQIQYGVVSSVLYHSSLGLGRGSLISLADFTPEEQDNIAPLRRLLYTLWRSSLLIGSWT